MALDTARIDSPPSTRCSQAERLTWVHQPQARLTVPADLGWSTWTRPRDYVPSGPIPVFPVFPALIPVPTVIPVPVFPTVIPVPVIPVIPVLIPVIPVLIPMPLGGRPERCGRPGGSSVRCSVCS